MKKLTKLLLVSMALVSVSCTDDVESKGPSKGLLKKWSMFSNPTSIKPLILRS